MRSMPAKRSPMTCSVPNVSQTGTEYFAAKAGTPPTWSVCSCVTKIASSDSGATPSRSSRPAVSRTPNPQSMRMRVVPASTTSPLPSLPLPIDAKRISAARRSLQLILEQREDLLAVLRLVGRPGRVLHAHDGRRCFLDDLDPVLLG